MATTRQMIMSRIDEALANRANRDGQLWSLAIALYELADQCPRPVLCQTGPIDNADRHACAARVAAADEAFVLASKYTERADCVSVALNVRQALYGAISQAAYAEAYMAAYLAPPSEVIQTARAVCRGVAE